VRLFEASDFEGFLRLKTATLHDDLNCSAEPGLETLAAAKTSAEDLEYSHAVLFEPPNYHFELLEFDQPIGMTSILASPEKGEARFLDSYIFNFYRGEGLSQLLYTARANFLQDRFPEIRNVYAHIRDQNTASRRAALRYGFEQVAGDWAGHLHANVVHTRIPGWSCFHMKLCL
jgi:RimJ/RimL family protein N-acetyltransferase